MHLNNQDKTYNRGSDVEFGIINGSTYDIAVSDPNNGNMQRWNILFAKLYCERY